MFDRIGRETRRAAVLVVGCSLLAAGVALLVLPGPGLLVMLLGLGVLAAEFDWARRSLDRAKGWAASHLEGTAIGRWLDRHDPVSLDERARHRGTPARRRGRDAA